MSMMDLIEEEYEDRIEILNEKIKQLEAEIAKRPAKPLYGEARSLILKAIDNSATVNDAIKKWEQLKAEVAELKEWRRRYDAGAAEREWKALGGSW